MPIVDAQVHIWAANTPERPWPARHEAHKPQPITAEDMLREMNTAGVDRCVLVPPSWEGERNDVCLAAAQKYPKRFAVMGRLDVDAPESRAKIATWRSQPGMLGLRFTMHRPLLRPILTEGRIDWLWPEAEKAGVPVMALALLVMREGGAKNTSMKSVVGANPRIQGAKLIVVPTAGASWGYGLYVRPDAPQEATRKATRLFTGLKGEYVPVAETVESFEALLRGDLDDVPEQAFLNVGGVEQVLAKAKALQEG